MAKPLPGLWERYVNMLICQAVRTTLTIDDDIYRRIKALAALRGESVTAVVEESLRVTLLSAQTPETVVPMPVSKRRSGYAPEFVSSGVDPANTRAVRDYLDRNDG